jgi:hypothetical protein
MNKCQNTAAERETDFTRFNGGMLRYINTFYRARQGTKFGNVFESLAFLAGNWCAEMQRNGDQRSFAELFLHFQGMMRGAYTLRRLGAVRQRGARH